MFNFSIRSSITALLLILFLNPSSVYSDIINVPDDFERIQQAINESEDGDTVLVQAGEYVERINYGGRNITVASLFLTTGFEGYIDSTIIDGDSSGTVVTFENEETEDAKLVGFTIQNGAARYGGGIYCNDSSPTISYCVIRENSTDNFGGGIFIWESNVDFDHCNLTNNRGPRNYTCMYLLGSNVTFNNCVFSDHIIDEHSDFILHIASSEVLFNNCTITNNTDCYRYWFRIRSEANVSFLNCIIYSNTGRVFLEDEARISFSYTDFEGGQDSIYDHNENGEINWGDGNIDEDPQFADPDNGDYHLTPDSPCIDTGDPNSPRDRNGTRADMGALPYEVGSYVGGFVLRAGDDEPIEDALVRDNYYWETLADSSGFFFMECPTLDSFDLMVTHEGFNDAIMSDLYVDDGDTLDVTFRLTYPLFILSSDSIGVSLEANTETDIEVTINNDGNGPMQWKARKHYPYFDPWEMRRSFSTSEEVNDIRLEGVVFINDHFYVSGANVHNREDDSNMIYVLDRDGNEINRFEQFGDSRYGMKGLAWDGELIWGGDDNSVIGFTTNGDSITSFETPDDFINAVTWDPDREVLWVARKTGREIYACDTDGNWEETLPRCDFRIYDLAYFGDDPDGYNLYIFNDPDNSRQVVHKMNTETGDTMFVALLEPEMGGSPGGAFITNTYDQRCWVFVSIVDNAADDRIDIYQIDANMSWITLEPMLGEIEAEQSQNLTLSIFTEGLTVPDWEAELVFSHNAAGGETILPVTLTIRPDAVKNDKYSLIPTEFEITQIYPNPFNSAVTVNYNLPVNSDVSLQLFDITGRVVTMVFNEWKSAGTHKVIIDNSGLSAGLYFIWLESRSDVAVRKVVFVK